MLEIKGKVKIQLFASQRSSRTSQSSRSEECAIIRSQKAAGFALCRMFMLEKDAPLERQ